jgi:hypothetical protein
MARIVSEHIVGVPGPQGIESGGSTGWLRQEFDTSAGAEEKADIVMVAASPACAENIITYQFLDKDHQPLEPQYHMRSSNERWNFALGMHLNPSTTTAQYLRVHRYDSVKRYLIDLGKMPGTPAENDDVRDLMDVQIPFLYYTGSHPQADLVSAAAQLFFIRFNRCRPADLSPQERRFISAREIIEAMMAANDGSYLEADMKRKRLYLLESRNMINSISDWLEEVF